MSYDVLNRAICGGKATGYAVLITLAILLCWAAVRVAVPLAPTVLPALQAIPVNLWRIPVAGVLVYLALRYPAYWLLLAGLACYRGIRWLVGGTVRDDIHLAILAYRYDKTLEREQEQRRQQNLHNIRQQREATEIFRAGRLAGIRKLMKHHLSVHRRFALVGRRQVMRLGQALNELKPEISGSGLLLAASWIGFCIFFGSTKLENAQGEAPPLILQVIWGLMLLGLYNKIAVKVGTLIWDILDKRSIPTKSERNRACLIGAQIPLWAWAASRIYGFSLLEQGLAFLLGLYAMAASLGFYYQCSTTPYFGRKN